MFPKVKQEEYSESLKSKEPTKEPLAQACLLKNVKTDQIEEPKASLQIKRQKNLKSESKENLRPLELRNRTIKRLIKAEKKVKTNLKASSFKYPKTQLDQVVKKESGLDKIS